jgi:UPF0271 protein
MPEGELYITPAVEGEMRPGGRMRRKLDFYLEAKIKVQAPSPESIAKVKELAGKTGDAARISETDAEVLALALDLGEGATVLTDDYSIQNLAKLLGVPYASMQMKGIKSVFHWDYVCSGCRRKYDAPRETCPECGSKIKTKRRKEDKGAETKGAENK